MGLDKFVRDVLVEVITGVHDAAEDVRKQHVADPALRGAVNVAGTTSDVQFDVAVTVSKREGGQLGLHVPFFDVGAKGEVSAAEETVNHIKFSVPVAFASQPVGPQYIKTGAPGPSPVESDPAVGKGGG